MPSGLMAADLKRPNIVFILSDDHAYQAISAYGDARRLIETPNIDRIAKEGVLFKRCLVPNSLCGPSRATILTGTYNHINGFVNNTNCRFDGSQTTFPKLLQAAGYETAIIGKWHLETDPTGFDYWQILPGQGVYYNPPMIRMGQPIMTQGYVTDIVTDASLEWLKGRDKSKPFFLMCGQKAPHRDWEPALRDLDFDGGRKYLEPSTLFDDYSGRGIAEHTQNMTIAQAMNDHDFKFIAPTDLSPEQRKNWDAYYDPRNAAFRKADLSGRALVSWKYQRFMHDYLGCVKSLDDNVGRVLKYLDNEGLADNTIVAYSSDQGFYLGRTRLVRQTLDFRGVATHAASHALAGGRQGRPRRRRYRGQSRFRRDFPGGGRPSRIVANAGPQSGSRSGRKDAGGLAKEFLLSVFRVPRFPSRTSPLWHRH